MKKTLGKYVCAVSLFFFWNSLFAEWDCSTLTALSQESQKQFLRGYTYGAAMEMKMLSLNYTTRKLDKIDISSEDLDQFTQRLLATRQYVKSRYTEMNIAFVYPEDFHRYVLDACEKSPGNDLFIIFPQVLQRMDITGEFPVHGM